MKEHEKKQTVKKESIVSGPNFLAHWFVYDYVRCDGISELEKAMHTINRHGYDLVSVTQDSKDIFTVFFRRRACG